MLDDPTLWLGKPTLQSPGLSVLQTVDKPTLPGTDADAYARVRESGQTLMIARRGGRFLGIVGVLDASRAESAQVLGALRSAGVGQLVMISGDNQRVAETVGREVAVDTAIGELLPEDKVTQIVRLAETHRSIAMVGDGVNDAPAMARADVGIAMGAAGSTVALETCDIALMSDDLGRLPFAVRLSRATGCSPLPPGCDRAPVTNAPRRPGASRSRGRCSSPRTAL